MAKPVAPKAKEKPQGAQRRSLEILEAMPRYYGVSSGNQERRRYANHPVHAASPRKTEAKATETVRYPGASEFAGPPADEAPVEDFETGVLAFDSTVLVEVFLFTEADDEDATDFTAFFAEAVVFEPVCVFEDAEAPDFTAISPATEISMGVFDVHCAVSMTNASRYDAGTVFQSVEVDAQNLFLPSEKSQYDRDFDGTPSALKDTGQFEE